VSLSPCAIVAAKPTAATASTDPAKTTSTKVMPRTLAALRRRGVRGIAPKLANLFTIHRPPSHPSARGFPARGCWLEPMFWLTPEQGVIFAPGVPLTPGYLVPGEPVSLLVRQASWV
jgi:hypothetical protein